MSENSKRGFLVGGIAVLVVAVLVVGFRGTRKKAPPSFERPPAAVTVAAAVARDVPVYLDEVGKCVAREVVSVQPQVSGRITQIHFTDGADVKKGRSALHHRSAARTRRSSTAAQANLAQASAAWTSPRVSGRRARDARPDEGHLPGGVRHAEERRRAWREAQVQQAEAAVETARLNLEYCSIRSPIDGRAGQRLVDLGNVVTANERLAPDASSGWIPIYAEFTVTENDLTAVQRQHAGGDAQGRGPAARRAGQAASPGTLTFLDNAVQDGDRDGEAARDRCRTASAASGRAGSSRSG